MNAQARGDGEIELTGVGPLSDARAGDVTYVADAARLDQTGESEAAAMIVPPKLADHVALAGRSLLVAKDPKLAFARAIAAFHSKPYRARGVSPDLILGENSRVGADCSIHPRVTIGRDSLIGDRVTLHPGVVIGDNCRVGDDTVIFANVSVYDETEIGARCRIHSGSVIGADGFSFTPDEGRRQFKLLQVGRVVIEDDVEIGAATTIDRASVGESRIGHGSKLDNLVQVGHSCTIGEDTLLCAQVGLAGSSHIGNRVILAGQAGVAGHLTIGDDVVLTAKSATSHDIPAGKIISGIPAFDNKDWLRSTAAFRRLGQLQRTVRELERKLGPDDTDESV